MTQSKPPQSVIVAVTGGIAAYKAADLTSKLSQKGVKVRVAMSENAQQFVAPLTFEAISGYPVYRQVFEDAASFQMEHISWARWADALVIAPATADVIARLAQGRADDAITTLYLAFTGPTYLAPSMNTTMLTHPATQANLAVLRERGVIIIEPGTGSLACGETGSGRMAEPARIMEELGLGESDGELEKVQATAAIGMQLPADKSLAGKIVLITSGPTHEYLDPVRFLSNPSTGKMGLALAQEAYRRGATVHFVTGPVQDSLIPAGDNRMILHRVVSARDMYHEVAELKDKAHLFIFAAAVGDFRPAHPIAQKIKRTGNSITLPLVENPDIAQAIGHGKQDWQVCIGFAAETQNHASNATDKIRRKHLDVVVLNDVGNPAIGFGSANNEVFIIQPDGTEQHVATTSKAQVAFEVLQMAQRLLEAKELS